jgi:hypothetical protein
MRIGRMLVATALATAASSPVTILAQGSSDASTAGTMPGERIYVQSEDVSRGPYHGGYMGYAGEADSMLAGQAVGAIAADRSMNGSVLTIVAQNGDIVANGTTTDLAQATRLERKLKTMGAKHVFSWFDSPGGN